MYFHIFFVVGYYYNFNKNRIQILLVTKTDDKKDTITSFQKAFSLSKSSFQRSNIVQIMLSEHAMIVINNLPPWLRHWFLLQQGTCRSTNKDRESKEVL